MTLVGELGPCIPGFGIAPKCDGIIGILKQMGDTMAQSLAIAASPMGAAIESFYVLAFRLHWALHWGCSQQWGPAAQH